jgi:hypothetical protein
MNSISAQNFNKRPRTRGRFGRILPATLIILLLTAVSALAEPVTVNHVVQTLTSSQGTLDLRVNTLVQDPAKGTQQNGPRGESVAKSQAPPVGGKTESLISGVVVAAEGSSIGVEDIEEGEVEGTICDCGEIFIAGGAFPKWPLLFLAAVPVVFIHDCNDCDEQTDSTPTPTPPSTPTPTPTTPTPEPASLLLFGSGLLAAGAGLRRRHGKSKNVEQIKEDQ